VQAPQLKHASEIFSQNSVLWKRSSSFLAMTLSSTQVNLVLKERPAATVSSKYFISSAEASVSEPNEESRFSPLGVIAFNSRPSPFSS